ncbi:Transmembrane protein [Entamoeba marina]
MSFLLNIVLSVAIPFAGFYKKSLDFYGMLTSIITAFIHLCVGVPAIYLLTFFVTSSILTKVGKKQKKKLEVKYSEESVRGYSQVLCNSLFSSICCIILILYNGLMNQIVCASDQITLFLCFVIPGFYSCCNGDTWSSEIGILSKTSPIHICTFKTVPPGTNGGVSFLGLLSGLLGSLLIGIVGGIVFLFECWMSLTAFILVTLTITFSGVCGNLLDSILGGTLQYSGWDEETHYVVRQPTKTTKKICGRDVLSNSAINLITSSFSGILCGFIDVICSKHTLIY